MPRPELCDLCKEGDVGQPWCRDEANCHDLVAAYDAGCQDALANIRAICIYHRGPNGVGAEALDDIQRLIDREQKVPPTPEAEHA